MPAHSLRLLTRLGPVKAATTPPAMTRDMARGFSEVDRPSVAAKREKLATAMYSPSSAWETISSPNERSCTAR